MNQNKSHLHIVCFCTMCCWCSNKLMVQNTVLLLLVT